MKFVAEKKVKTMRIAVNAFAAAFEPVVVWYTAMKAKPVAESSESLVKQKQKVMSMTNPLITPMR